MNEQPTLGGSNNSWECGPSAVADVAYRRGPVAAENLGCKMPHGVLTRRHHSKMCRMEESCMASFDTWFTAPADRCSRRRL